MSQGYQTRRITVRLDGPLYVAVREAAAVHKTSMNKLCLDAIQAHLEFLKEQAKGDPSDWDANRGQPVH